VLISQRKGKAADEALKGIATAYFLWRNLYLCYNKKRKTSWALSQKKPIMQINVAATPRFSLPLSQAHIELLTQLSRSHYDSMCKAAGVPGVEGFIHGWGGRLAFAQEEGEPAPKVDATRSQLDLTLKILENTMGLPKADVATAQYLTRNLRGALQYSSEVVPTWNAVFGGVE
jgi:hypothetical protein